ncbi:MAG TPA: hypothetical protein VFS78_18590 [Vicinamibacteria bacterium]|nr:hypothetical protein [Vicinamibacteria bacterium]
MGKTREGLDTLQRKQDAAFRLDARGPISAPRAAEDFLAKVGIALRYGATKGLPLASLYQAFAGADPDKAALARGITLTNRLLGEARGIEVHVIAERVTLVHRSLMPPLYTLVRRGRALDDLDGLGVHARTALALLRERKEVTAGDVRQRLGLRADPRQDPAYAALGELTRLLLVDRGPFQVPKAGIPYLSTEGYPYHLLDEVHPELVRAAARHSVDAAADGLLEAYINGAVFVRVRKLATLFRFLSSGEIDAALVRLGARGAVALEGTGRDVIAVRIQGRA